MGMGDVGGGRGFVHVLLGVAAMVGAIGTGGIAASAQPAPAEAPITVQARGGAGAAAMVQAARQRGGMRVIVGLASPAAPEDHLTASAAGAQRARLASVQDAVVSGLRQRKVTKFESIPFMVVDTDAAGLQSLLADSRVATVQEDVAVPLALTQSVPLIRADQTAARGFSGKGQVVAILDTGVAKKHPMLQGKVVSEACYSTTNKSEGAKSLCPGGIRSSTAAGSGKSCTIFDCEHGTHVASIAAGNSSSLKGVARDTKIISIQIYSNIGGSPGAYYSDIISGLERVYQLRKKYKIASANLSLGTSNLYSSPCDGQLPAVKAIIDNLRSARIATVIASGNDYADGAISAPACISTAVAVGSTTKKDKVSDFSNHSKLVDLMAPGSDIYAAVPGGYQRMSGTSMATPHVAGAWAILKQAKPNASVDEIQAALECTGVKVSRGGVTKRRINVLAALNVLRSPATGCK